MATDFLTRDNAGLGFDLHKCLTGQVVTSAAFKRFLIVIICDKDHAGKLLHYNVTHNVMRLVNLLSHAEKGEFCIVEGVVSRHGI